MCFAFRRSVGRRRSVFQPRKFLAAAGILASTIAFAVPLGGCPDDEVCRDYVPPGSFDAQNPKVSFSRDVMPIFSQSCAFTACHGSISGNPNGVFLGGNDPQKVHRAIVDVRSGRLNTMSFVEPGEPRESFLLRKIDGSHCVIPECASTDCGKAMPRSDDKLPLETRDVVRRWIAQGAKND
jgi:hypothetical protein